MTIPRITTCDSLLEALDQRPTHDEEGAAAFDREVWSQVGAEGAMLVTDLSGFTRLTKRHGILHFLAMFRRCQRVCLPILEAHGGKLLKTEADDFIVLFDDVSQALDSALEMLSAMGTMNRAFPPEDRVYMCIGIEWGSMLRLEDDAFGDVVNVAFKLGEDIAEPDEILLGEVAFERAMGAGYDFSKCVLSEPKVAVAGNVKLPHRSLRPIDAR